VPDRQAALPVLLEDGDDLEPEGRHAGQVGRHEQHGVPPGRDIDHAAERNLCPTFGQLPEGQLDQLDRVPHRDDLANVALVECQHRFTTPRVVFSSSAPGNSFPESIAEMRLPWYTYAPLSMTTRHRKDYVTTH